MSASSPTACRASSRQPAARGTAAGGAGPAPTWRAPVRVAIDYADAAELADKADKALKALQSGQPAAWRMLRSQGVFLGRGPAPKVAFLYTGQGSQYVNMLKALRDDRAGRRRPPSTRPIGS